MRLHADRLTRSDIRAAMPGDTWPIRLAEHGSRHRAHGWDVVLGGTAYYRSQADREEYAATWDEWGIFLSQLFLADTSLTIPRVYDDAEHFHWSTVDRFDRLTVDQQHRRHRWEFHGEAVTGAYWVYRCKGCEAGMRRLAGFRTWHDFQVFNGERPEPNTVNRETVPESAARLAAMVG